MGEKRADQLIQTQDGSFTWHSSTYDEQFHSHGGALLEAQRIYVKGCQLEQLAQQKQHIRILDIGFGLGYNVFCAIDAIFKVWGKKDCAKLEIVSFESDPDVLCFNDYPEFLLPLTQNIKSSWIKGYVSSSRMLTKRLSHHFLDGLCQQPASNEIVFLDNNLSLKIYLEDARLGIQKNLAEPFDAIFHDPFSPPKNPELWTVDFFKKCHEHLDEKGCLATYSMATPVLNAMLEAGLFPYLSEGTGTKRYCTLATKTKKYDLPKNFQKKLSSSPERFCYRDPLLQASRSQIFSERLSFSRMRESK